jgi:hypothetical protein
VAESSPLPASGAGAPAGADSPAGASASRLAGVLLGLLVLALCAFTAFGGGWSEVSSAEVIAGRYELGPLPDGYALDPLAHALRGGEQVVRFVREGSEEDLAELTAAALGRTAAAVATGEEVDWSALLPSSAGTPPAVVLLVRYPLAAGERVIREQFRGLEYRDLSRLGERGGSTAVDGGELAWHGYAADHVRVRRFGPGPTFRDVVRVNLSLGRECWIAYAVWPALAEGSVEPVAAVLDALRPRRD